MVSKNVKTADYSVPQRRGQRTKCKVLPHFNNSLPFQLVEITNDIDDSVKYGILNEQRSTSTNLYVWIDKNICETKIEYRHLRAISLPHPPQIAFDEFQATIGGIGLHTRWKVILSKKHFKGDCKLVVTNIMNTQKFELFVQKRIRPFAFSNFQFKSHKNLFTTEVIIPDHKDLTFVAAAFHCQGYRVIPVNDDMASYGNIGIERYDRSEHTWWNQNQKEAGPLRDTHKWKYNFVPKTWTIIPFTWQSMAQNIHVEKEDIDKIPLPLRNHVCDVMVNNISDEKEKTLISAYKKVNCVTSRLTYEQNIQILRVTYWTFVAPFDSKITYLSGILQFRYMLHGYVGREVGGYRQEAQHIGHGAFCRKFKGKPQYEYNNLDTDVQNKIQQDNGRLLGNGFKGTRGKYGDESYPKYQPTKKMKRSVESEIAIREEPYNKFEQYESNNTVNAV